MKQTAVEWFAEQEIQLTIDFAQKKINNVEYGIRKLRLIDQAKEMEKEQIMHAWLIDGYTDITDDNWKKEFNEYYKETYEKE